MSSVTNDRSSETLTATGQLVNGALSSTAMMSGMQPVDKAMTDYFNGRRPQLAGSYRGFLTNVTSVAPNQAVAYGAYGAALAVLAPQGNATPKDKEKATVFAVVAQTPTTTLFENLKVKQQLAEHPMTARQVAQKVVVDDGYRGLMRGATMTVLRDLFWYETMLRLRQKVEDAQPAALGNGTVRKLVSGAEAGALCGLATASLANVKTKMQGDGWTQKPGKPNEGHPKGTFDKVGKTVKHVYQKEGMKGLLLPKGTGARVLFLAGAVPSMGFFADYFPQYYPSFLHRDA